MGQPQCSLCGRPAVYKCGNCFAYFLCRDCPSKIGGGALSEPKCPRCGANNWIAA